MSELDISNSVAIIGMAGRFPGAKNLDEFWLNLCNGVESTTFFSDEELQATGIDPSLLNDPNYIKAGAILEDIDRFDAAFFGFNPREAAIIDPQHRLFLECAWEALEAAGYNSQTYAGRIGTYAGVGWNSYLTSNLASNPELLQPSAEGYQTLIGNEKDYLTTRVSYQLNLTGPSINIQTACSTSLVAVCMACQSLQTYQCDMALAGGVTLSVPHKAGYFYQQGGILSPDSRCRAFDAKAQGTFPGNGVGIVVLKRLEDAIADNDCIHAVIRSSAMNNDGALKVGYTAPSVDGQAEVIAEAIALADLDPETIAYIETHGTGTALGDPIEIAALTKAFRAKTQKKGFCAIGSVKTNIGHLDTAAGVASLIKTVLALKHKKIPPSLHFEQPNPQIDFANSPFFVNTKLCEWESNGTSRRAGVSSFGIGGTNAHVILEEFHAEAQRRRGQREEGGTRGQGDKGTRRQGELIQNLTWQLLVLSAKTESALETATDNLARHLDKHSELNLADVAYTLQVGRREFNYRRIAIALDIEDTIDILTSRDPQKVFTRFQEPGDRAIAFLFPGQGAQYVNMGRELYHTESVFREWIDRSAKLLESYLKLDLRSLLFPSESEVEAAEKLKQTEFAQPALFAIEYALAQLWISWGIIPGAAIGHSIGEYVAACLSGVMSFEDALMLVAKRGRLMQQMPTGAMLAVFLPEAEVKTLLNENVSLAASNAPNLCVVSGTEKAIETLIEQLAAKGIECRRLHTSHAFHSQMMEPVREAFLEEVKKVKLNPPTIPFISNVTGTWITSTQATDANYWAKHLRQTVKFAGGISQLLQPDRILIEVGPGRTLSSLVKQQNPTQEVFSSLRHPKQQDSDVTFLLKSLGQLWLSGVAVNWEGFHAGKQRGRVPLPTYPFERQRYWIEPQTTVRKLAKKSNINDWFYVPSWKQVPLIKTKEIPSGCYLVFVDECGIGSQLVRQLQLAGQDAIAISTGENFEQRDRNNYTINPTNPNDYFALIQFITEQGNIPNQIIYLWSVTQSLETNQTLGFDSLLYLAQALEKQNNPIQLVVIANHLYQIIGNELLSPQKATILGACKVIPQDCSNINCCLIDVEIDASEKDKLIKQLIAEIKVTSENAIAAYRNNRRWVQIFEPISLEKNTQEPTLLRQEGVYLITGGLGEIALVLAEYLARTVQAKLILVGRSQLPKKEAWEEWLATHPPQDITSKKIGKLQALEKLGSQVLILSADVTNYDQMQQAIATAIKQFATINGVIHAAGIAGGGAIQLKILEAAEKVLAPKVEGTLILDELLKDINLDFWVLCSSLSSILGEFGQVDYCGANAFLDAFSHYKASQNSYPTVAINWDTWQEVGMAVNANIPNAFKQQREEILKQGITPTEGIDIFSRILQSGLSQVIVSTRDLPEVIEQQKNFSIASPAIPDLSITHSSISIQNFDNEVEQTISYLWQQFFGLEKIGIHDDFFDLGGHSLLAVQIASKLREIFQIELSVKELMFEATTVGKLAVLVVDKKDRQKDIDEIEKILEEVETNYSN
ncbi:beta-ketoacyl synthase [Hydrococcus rivularis NIES-593]|uniref:Beta-ketoacyl synthase n=1 Tax=Hydrococcus rivularis NIES-593 TaxID=1921803 RepID=A0A1U7HBC4_9CYAN|nr:type I polyketide synthase [Hydrococcus rivularis]OKH20880.1 beta-ketoacyl synthase [Hydrococcus rivularis NIES-593]